jgi:spore germination protein KC
MNRKILLCVILILTVICCNGCWDRKELKTLAIIAGMGLDRTPDGKLAVTFQIINPGGVKSGAAPSEGGGGAAAPQPYG